MDFIEPCFGIGHNLSLICQMTSEDIKHQLNNNSRGNLQHHDRQLSTDSLPYGEATTATRVCGTNAFDILYRPSRWLISWLTDWLTDCLFDRLTDCGWLTACLTDWLTNKTVTSSRDFRYKQPETKGSERRTPCHNENTTIRRRVIMKIPQLGAACKYYLRTVHTVSDTERNKNK